MTFGERLTKARENKGYKQNQFAEMIGITPTRLNYWEKGKREPDVAMIKQISVLLDVSCDWLIGNDNTTPKSFDIENSEKTLLNKYRLLDSHGKKIVDVVLDVEYERCQEQEETVKVYRVAQSDDDHPAEIEEMKKSELNRLHSLPMTDEDL